jgi:hypothetical protein
VNGTSSFNVGQTPSLVTDAMPTTATLFKFGAEITGHLSWMCLLPCVLLSTTRGGLNKKSISYKYILKSRTI